MSLQPKVLAKLEKLHPGLPKKFLGLLATNIAKKVTEEDGIDDAIKEFDDTMSIKQLAKQFTSEVDRRVGEARSEWEKSKDTDEDDDDDDLIGPVAGEEKPTQRTTKKRKKKDDDPPSWAQKMMDELKSFKEEKVATTIKGKLSERLKDKVPTEFYDNWKLPSTDDDLETFATQVEEKYTAFQEKLVSDGLISTRTPVASTAGSNGKENPKDIEKDINEYLNKGKKDPSKK